MIAVTKNKLMLNHSSLTNTDSFFIEGDVIVPDSLPDVSNILFSDAFPIVEDYLVNSGQITISGNVEFNIIYTTEENPNELLRISTSIPFKNSFSVPNLDADAKISLRLSPEKVSSLILNGRKISISAELGLSLTYSAPMEITYVELPSDIETLQTMKSNKCVCLFKDSQKKTTTVRDTAMLETSMPSIKEIIKYDASLQNEESVISDNKVAVKGEILLKIYYTSEDSHNINMFEMILPYSDITDTQDTSGDSCIEVFSNVNSVSLKMLPDSDEMMRIIEADVVVSSLINIFENLSLELVDDAYDIESNLTSKMETFNYECCTSIINEDIAFKGTITIPEDNDIKVLASFGKVKSASLQKESDKTMLNGTIEVTSLYFVPETNQINSISIDMPITHILSSDDLAVLKNITVRDTTLSQLDNDKFEVKINLSVSGKARKNCSVDILTEISESDDMAKKAPGITIYYTKPGDTLWTIAKKFSTTVQNIADMNSLENADKIEAGMALVV